MGEYNPNGCFVKMGQSGLSSGQIRAARALLRWSALDLAREAAVGANTVRRAEVADHETSLTAANERAIREALEKAGIEFISENGGGAGVRWRKRHAQIARAKGK
nr:transcriptional regulator [Nitrobacter sp. 62-13]